MLFHYIGNRIFNIQTRKIANNLGYTLNQYGLFDINSNKKIDFEPNGEVDIFKFLKIPYKKPEERNY